MQEIDRFKFRMWDGEKMHYNAEKTYDYGCNGDNVIQASSFGELLEREDITLMQATGLQDKNGKLIFESDVVSAEPINTFDFPHTKGFKVGVCEYYYGRFGLKMPNVHGGFCDFFTLNNREIIGNRFENPELLNNL